MDDSTYQVYTFLTPAGSYRANDNHRIVTDRGLVQLPNELKECVLQALRELAPLDEPPR
jgi:hypothetical protein